MSYSVCLSAGIVGGGAIGATSLSAIGGISLGDIGCLGATSSSLFLSVISSFSNLHQK